MLRSQWEYGDDAGVARTGFTIRELNEYIGGTRKDGGGQDLKLWPPRAYIVAFGEEYRSFKEDWMISKQLR